MYSPDLKNQCLFGGFAFYYILYTSLHLIHFVFQTEWNYFNVFLRKEGKDSSLPMFFCSKWSVEKVVDYAASLASLKNNNNILTANLKDNSHEQQAPSRQTYSTVIVIQIRINIQINIYYNV